MKRATQIYCAVFPTGLIKIGRTHSLRFRVLGLRQEAKMVPKIRFAINEADSSVAKHLELVAIQELEGHGAHGREWFKPTALRLLPDLERYLRRYQRTITRNILKLKLAVVR